MSPFSFVHWVVCPSLYGLWWALSLLRSWREEGQTTWWTKEKGLIIRGHKEKKDRQPNGQKKKGIISGHKEWPLMTPLSFVHWVVCPSLYGLWWPLSLLSIGLSVLLLFMASTDNPMDKRQRVHQRP
jgi:hypothetical protein